MQDTSRQLPQDWIVSVMLMDKPSVSGEVRAFTEAEALAEFKALKKIVGSEILMEAAYVPNFRTEESEVAAVAEYNSYPAGLR